MTFCVTVRTADSRASVKAVDADALLALDDCDFLDLGTVAPHSEMDFAVFNGQQLLISEMEPNAGAFSALSLVDGEAA